MSLVTVPRVHTGCNCHRKPTKPPVTTSFPTLKKHVSRLLLTALIFSHFLHYQLKFSISLSHLSLYRFKKETPLICEIQTNNFFSRASFRIGQMASLRSYCASLRYSTFQFLRSTTADICKRTDTKRRSPRAAIIRNFHLQTRSYEIKNRALPEDVKSLKLITAIKTPYLPDGRLDLEAYDGLVNMQIKQGADGILVGGTTGEGQLMSWDELIMLIGRTVNNFGESVKVIGKIGSTSTRAAVDATEKAFGVGMHAALHLNPYYGITSSEGLVSHFKTLLSVGPGIIYNVPYRTGQDIPPHVIYSLKQNPNFAGIKECVGIDRIKEYADNGIVVWTGNDNQCHDARWGAGLSGMMSVASNLVPGLIRELMLGEKNPSLNSKLMPLLSWLYKEPNPIGLNTALAQLGVVKPVFRLPYVPLPREKRVEFVNLVKDFGRENFVGKKDVQVLDDDDFIVVVG